MASASIDPKEIEKFSRIADSWWDEHGSFAPLHRINPIRIEYILKKVAGCGLQSLQDLRLLDIGCGGGLLAEPMARLGAQVTGIDASPQNIEIAKLHATGEGLNIDYKCSSVEKFAVTRNLPLFNIILALEIIEHVADVPGFLETCCKLLAPGGIMILSTINRTLKSLALAKIGAEYILRWLPIGTHDWRKFLNPGEIEPLLRANGLKLAELKGMSYSPLKNSWHLTDDISVNYFMLVVRGS